MILMEKYHNLFSTFEGFERKTINFSELPATIRSYSSGLGADLNYEGDFYNHMDAWLEFIEFCYPQEDWYSLGLSLVNFLKISVINAPLKVRYHASDRVISEQLRHFLSLNKQLE